MTRLKHLARISVSNVDKKAREEQAAVRLCNYTDVYYGDVISASTGDYMSATATEAQLATFRLLAGDTVLTKDSETAEDIGVSAYIAESAPDFVCGYHLARLRPDTERVHPKFLFWASRGSHVRDQLRVAATGVTRMGLRTEAFANVEMQVPALDDQRRIADFLDTQVALLEHVKVLRQHQGLLLEERRQAILAAAYSGAGVLLPLRRVVERWIDYRGATPTKTESGVPLVTAKNIRHGVISFDRSAEYIGTADYESWMRRGYPILGDVLLTTEAPLGEVAQITDEGIALAQRVILLRPNPRKVSARWLYWYLRSPRGQRELWLRATGTTAQGIKAERLREVPIPVPELVEQHSRLAEVEVIEQQWSSVRALLTASSALLDERKQALIDAAVTGQFDVAAARKVAADV